MRPYSKQATLKIKSDSLKLRIKSILLPHKVNGERSLILFHQTLSALEKTSLNRDAQTYLFHFAISRLSILQDYVHKSTHLPLNSHSEPHVDINQADIDHEKNVFWSILLLSLAKCGQGT